MPAKPQAGIQATDLDIRYDSSEDRLLLTARSGEGRADLWLTRRLARAVLGGLVDLLLRSNADAQRAALEQRNDVLLFEHLAALERHPVAAVPTAAATGAAPAAAPAVAHLLQRIDLSVTAAGLELRLTGAATEALAEFRMPRESGHQLLHALTAKCREAQWDFPEFDWIDRRANMVVPAGLRPC